METKKSACRKWQIILGEYVLGTVDERDRARLERHLRRCESCRRELAEMEEMYRLLGDFELAKPGSFFAAKVARAVRDEAEAAWAAVTEFATAMGIERTPYLAGLLFHHPSREKAVYLDSDGSLREASVALGDVLRHAT